jgi:peptidoglycan hydrolase CwlO-like protein
MIDRKEYRKNIELINEDLIELKEEVEENEFKKIEKKHRKFLNRKKRVRHMKTKSNLYKCLNVLMEKRGLFELLQRVRHFSFSHDVLRIVFASLIFVFSKGMLVISWQF